MPTAAPPARPGRRAVYGEAMAGDADVSASTRDDGRDPRDVAVEEAWVAGRPDALRLAYDQFGALVHTYCVRALGDREQAADCVQETFVGAWRSSERYDRGRGTLAGWLLGIARYRVLDVRRRSPRVPTPVGDGRPETAAGPAGADVDGLVDRLLLVRALDSLPERARSVVELAFWSDLSQSEIAARLDVPLGTVKSDMRRALLRLRGHVEEGGAPDA